MVEQMDLENFGSCTLHGECQEACPKEISIDTITRMNRDFIKAGLPVALRYRYAPPRPQALELHLGRVTPVWPWYFPFLSLYDTSGSSSPLKNSTWAMPSFA